METIKERIVHFIDYLHISQRKFCEKNNLSHTFLSSNGSVVSGTLERFIINYPELNIEWVISGIGDMLKKGPDQAISIYNLVQEDKIKTAQAEADNYKSKYFEALELYYRCVAENNKTENIYATHSKNG